MQGTAVQKIWFFFSFWAHVALNTVLDRQGYGSYVATRKLVKRLREEKPDIIHLHNLHGYYLYLPLLFRYLTEEFQGRIFWTFHDCWPFTGHCAYFTEAGCEKWKEGCCKCPNKMQYPVSLFLDASGRNYRAKKEMFGRLENLTIIVPSEWMKNLTGLSFMGKYPIEVVSNGIDLEQFRYTADERVLKKYQIPDGKKILLGVANVWDRRKGLKDFIMLAGCLPQEYQIVLVGLSKRQIAQMPPGIVGIRHTDNVRELAALYSQACIFINPSREESFSLVTIEAMACGTPVIALGNSAVEELVCGENGVVLESYDSEDYLRAIREVEGKRFSRESVRRTVGKYDKKNMADRIIELYGK